MARDFSLEEMPKGYVWDTQDYIPDQRGANLESRGPWTYMTTASRAATVWSGLDGVFEAGEKLLVHAGGNIYEHPRALPGAATVSPTSLGSLFSQSLHNGKMLNDRAYFADGNGAAKPKYVTYPSGTATLTAITAANCPTPRHLEIHKERLIAGGGSVEITFLYFSPLEIDGGPPSAWDTASWIDTHRPITGLGVLGSQIFVFQDGRIQRIRGTLPPTTSVDTDMEQD